MSLEKDHGEIMKYLKIGHELLYLTQQEVVNTGLGVDEILGLTGEALIAHGKKDYEMPAKVGVHPFEDTLFHAMPAYVPANKAVGVKWIECYPSNPERYNLPQTTGLLIMNDTMTGCPVAVMDAAWITAMRTPAVTSLAAAALHPNAASFGMFGCGVQGIEHCRFIAHTLHKLEKIYIYDINRDAMEKLIEKVQPGLDIEIIRGRDPESVTKNCDVLSSATVILQEPLAAVKDEWVSAGQTILPCDLNTFWDPATTKRADKYIVDSADGHKLLASKGHFPGGLPPITAETGEVLAKIKPGRESSSDLIVCSNIGMAVCDVVVGKAIMMQALEKGIGRKLPV